MPLRFALPGDDYERLANVYLPADWYDYAPLPIVFVFHGGGMNMTNMAQQYPFYATSESHRDEYTIPAAVEAEVATDFARCAVVYFEGLSPDSPAIDVRANYNIGHRRTAVSQPWRYGRDVRAVEHLYHLLAEKLDRVLHHQLGQDPSIGALGSVHLFGYSNGGMLAYRMAARADLSIPLQSICVVSGCIGSAWDGGDPDDEIPIAGATPPRSILHLHGALDTEVPPGGGPRPAAVGEDQLLFEDQGLTADYFTHVDTPMDTAAAIWRAHTATFAGPGSPAHRKVFKLPHLTRPTVTTSTQMALPWVGVVATALYAEVPHKWQGPDPLYGIEARAAVCRMARLFFHSPFLFGPA